MTVPAQPVTGDGGLLAFDCPMCGAVVVADLDEGVCESGHAYRISYSRAAAFAVCDLGTTPGPVLRTPARKGDNSPPGASRLNSIRRVKANA